MATTSYDINGDTWNGTDPMTLDEGEYTVTATVTVTFASAATGDMNGAFNLGDAQLGLALPGAVSALPLGTGEARLEGTRLTLGPLSAWFGVLEG